MTKLTKEQERELIQNSIPFTLPSEKIINCCVMSNQEGGWFAFFPVDLPEEARIAIELEIFDNMVGEEDGEEEN